ncbi:MAG: hypothetical protein LC798_02985 [Chloroflexi bacterium]|nr:hypothetical protein [Chloroflexota bacterium]
MILLWDILRFSNLIVSGMSLALAGLVVYQATRSRKKVGGPPQLLFWHVCAIALGTEGMVLTGAAWSFTHLGQPPTMPILGFLPSTILITVALFLILKVQRARVLVQETIAVRVEEHHGD